MRSQFNPGILLCLDTAFIKTPVVGKIRKEIQDYGLRNYLELTIR